MENWSSIEYYKKQRLVWRQEGHTCSISSPDWELHCYKVWPQKRVCVYVCAMTQVEKEFLTCKQLFVSCALEHRPIILSFISRLLNSHNQ